MATTVKHVGAFDPVIWLRALTSIRGGYVPVSGRKLAFLVNDCDGEALTSAMSQIVGQPGRQEAIKKAIERRQMREAA